MVRPDFTSSVQAPVAGGRRTPLGAATEPRRLLGASQFLEGESRNLGRIKKAPLADFDDLCCHQLRKRIASVHETQRLQRLFIRSHQSRAFLRRNFKILQQSYDRHIPFLREAGQCPGSRFVADGTRVRGMDRDRGIRGTQGTKSQKRCADFATAFNGSATALKHDEFCLNRCVREPSDLSRLRGRSPRSKSAAGGGKHTYSARRSCPHLNPPPASGGGSAPPAQQYQPNFIVRRPSHGERSRSVKARKDAQPKRAGTASIGLNNSSKCHLAPTPRNGRTSLYRRTTSHAQSFANQRRRNSLGFTKTKSRSTSSRLTA